MTHPPQRRLLTALCSLCLCGLAGGNSPSFLPVPAKDVEVESLGRHEARDADEIRQKLPRVKVARAAQVFQFNQKDGRRTLCIDGRRSAEHAKDGKMAASLWSHDGGVTWIWREGPSENAANFAPATVGEEAAIQLRGSGEIVSIQQTSRPMKRNIAGNEMYFQDPPMQKTQAGFFLVQRRSQDGWRNARQEYAPLDTPNAAELTGDDGGKDPGFILHQGLVELPNGDLLASLYGNCTEDQTEDNRADGYPPSFKMYKMRTVVVRSKDRGRTWGDMRTVATRWMAGRNEDNDAGRAGTTRVPAITQEGFTESDLAVAPNGDVLCVMRTGGRLSTDSAPIYSTPLYQARSKDGGETWDDPVQIAPFGVNPVVVTLENGVMAATYARPGGWIMFSTDSGVTWKGHRQVTTSDSYTNVLAAGREEILVFYPADGGVWAERFRVKKVE